MMSLAVLNDGFAVVITLTPIDKPSDRRCLTITSANPCFIGRASKSTQKTLQSTPNNALFDCAVMSRNHAKVEANPWAASCDLVTLIDDGSMHGTYINGHRIVKGRRMALRQGDILRFGDNVARGDDLHKPMLVKYERLPDLHYGDALASPIVPALEIPKSTSRSPGFHVSVPSDAESSDSDSRSIHSDDEDGAESAFEVVDVQNSVLEQGLEHDERLEDALQNAATQSQYRSASPDVEFIRSIVTRSSPSIPDIEVLDSKTDRPDSPFISAAPKHYTYVESDDGNSMAEGCDTASAQAKNPDTMAAPIFGESDACETSNFFVPSETEHISLAGASVQRNTSENGVMDTDKDDAPEVLSSRYHLPYGEIPIYSPSHSECIDTSKVGNLGPKRFDPIRNDQLPPIVPFKPDGRNIRKSHSRWDKLPQSWLNGIAPLPVPNGMFPDTGPLQSAYELGLPGSPKSAQDPKHVSSVVPNLEPSWMPPPNLNSVPFNIPQPCWKPLRDYAPPLVREKISIDNLVDASLINSTVSAEAVINTGTKRKADVLNGDDDEDAPATRASAAPIAQPATTESVAPAVSTTSVETPAPSAANPADPNLDALPSRQTISERSVKRVKTDHSTSVGTKAKYFAAGSAAMHLVFHFNLVNLMLDRLGWPRYE